MAQLLNEADLNYTFVQHFALTLGTPIAVAEKLPLLTANPDELDYKKMKHLRKTVQSDATWFLYYESPEKLQLDRNDDVFTVSPYIYQWIDSTDWGTTEAEIREDIAQELPDFANYLNNRNFNRWILQHLLKNAARQALM